MARVQTCFSCIALLALAIGNAVAFGQEITASFESEFQWFDKSRVPDFSDQQDWSAVAWKGERLNKQILIRGVGSYERLSISAGDLLHEISAVDVVPASTMSFRFPTFVKGDVEARGCGGHSERGEVSWQSDALFSNPPTDSMDGSSGVVDDYPLIIWATIDVPREASTGNYLGTITIGNGQGTETTLQVSLHVADWRMPQASERKFHLDLWQFPVTALNRYNDSNPGRIIDVWSEEHLALLRPLYSYLAELGQRSVTTYISEGSLGAPSMIEWIAIDDGARWRYDYSAFDAYVEDLGEWGINQQINAFSIAGWNAGTITYRDEGSNDKKVLRTEVGSKSFRRIWTAFLSDFRKHLEERDWFARTVLYMDEIPSNHVESIIRLVRTDHLGWKIGLAFGRAPSERVINSLYDRSGNFGFFDRFKLNDRHDRVTTFYTSCTQIRPNTYVAADASPADMAAIPWHAFSKDLDGYLHWTFDNWKSSDPLDPRDGAHTAGDFSVVYRSSNREDMTVVPSVRSELLREGIEDYEKLSVLRTLGLLCDESCSPMRLLADDPYRCQAEELRSTIESFSVSQLEAGSGGDLVRRAREALDEYSKRATSYHCVPIPGQASTFPWR